MEFDILTTTNPYYNLALEEYALKNKLKSDILLFWQNDKTVVIGRNQNVLAEINCPYLYQNQIPIVRRITGGGSVFHDLGNLNFSFITSFESLESVSMEAFTSPIIKALQNLGLDAKLSGRNDILIGNKKVSGNAQALYKNRILHHGTLLFNTNLEDAVQALKAKSKYTSNDAVPSIRNRIENISTFLEKKMTMEEFKQYLVNTICKDTKKIEWQKEEIDKILNLKEKQYESWNWNFGKSPHFNFKNEKQYASGQYFLYLRGNLGKIEEVKIQGDYLSLRPTSEITDSLCGLPYDYSHLKKFLSQFDLAYYFGSLSLTELLDLFF